MIAFDTETALIRPGRAAPELACISICAEDNSTALVHWTEAHDAAEEILKCDMIVGHNLAFDMAVLCANFPDLAPKVFAAYEENRATCTMLRQQLLDIADGTMRGFVGYDGTWRKHQYSLDYTFRRHRLGQLEKDEWRLQYGQLRDLPLDQWPAGARHYPIMDAVATKQVWDIQGGLNYIPDEFERARVFFALELASVWGLKTNPADVAFLRTNTLEHLEKLKEELIYHGLVRPDGSRVTKAAQARIAEAWAALAKEGVKPHLTDKGAKLAMLREMQQGKEPSSFGKLFASLEKSGWVENGQITAKGLLELEKSTDCEGLQLDDDACKASRDPVMRAYAEYGETMYVLSKDLKMLEQASVLPVHTHFSMKDTTRTSSSKPQVQNLRRDEGIREVFEPRPGWCFWDGDFPQLELRSLAETCMVWFGTSKLADALNAGVDPHDVVASQILDCTVEEIVAGKKLDKHSEEYKRIFDARQCGKVANFGIPMGLGVKNLGEFARKIYNVILTEEKSRFIKDTWLKSWPEMRFYMQRIRQSKDGDKGIVLTMPHSNVVRGDMVFTSACSFPLQGLGAVAALHGLWRVTQECYNEKASPCYGARPVNFIHDQVIAELPYIRWGVDRTDAAARRMAEVFAAGAQEYLPHVKIFCEPVLCMKWSKNSEPVHDEQGRLVPWQYARKAA